jgi:predicted aspartyl protease
MRRFIVVATAACLAVPSAVAVAQAGPTAREASTVPLIVIHGRDGSTAAVARVVIHGHVFPFLIDTGATRSLVDVALARKLHLRTVGKPTPVFGVGCASSSRKVRLSGWSVGGQPLPNITAVSTVIAFANGRAFGLLGSDVLSRFGAFRLDYAHAELTLG